MDFNLLSRSPLFIGMSIPVIQQILDSIYWRTKIYSPGSLISASGDPVSGFMMVIEGKVKGEMTDYSGRVIKIEDIPAPGALAPAFLFGNRNRYPVNVISIEETKMLVIAKDDFIKLLMANGTILSNFLNMISNRSQFLSEKIKFLNFKTLRSKLAQYILQHTGEENNKFVLPMTQSDLADFFGVARPSLARALSGIEADGVILAQNRTITVLDRGTLMKLTND
jgi:CRP-like cAMP-binding protein